MSNVLWHLRLPLLNGLVEDVLLVSVVTATNEVWLILRGVQDAGGGE